MSISRNEKLIGGLDVRNLTGAEIGPLCRPVVRREDGAILYVDHADTQTLRGKYANDPGVDAAAIVDVDAVWGANTLDEALGGRKVDYIVASHVIEHVPDLITWLLELRSSLRGGGQVRLAVPDRRFTFDHLRRDSSLADVLTAHVLRARRPQIQQILDYRLNSAPIGCAEAWATPPHQRIIRKEHTFGEALSTARRFVANDDYHDVHCWAFTPRSFALLFAEMVENGLIDYGCERFYDTSRNELEFFVWLRQMDRDTAVESWQDMARQVSDIYEGDTQLKHELADMTARLEAMERSTSWRITAPLRGLKAWLFTWPLLTRSYDKNSA